MTQSSTLSKTREETLLKLELSGSSSSLSLALDVLTNLSECLKITGLDLRALHIKETSEGSLIVDLCIVPCKPVEYIQLAQTDWLGLRLGDF